MGSIKTPFGRFVKFPIIRDPKTILGPLFLSGGPPFLRKNDEATIEDVFIRSIDEVKGKIEEWSQSGSGWVIEVFWKRSFMSLYMNHFVEEATCHCQVASKEEHDP